MKNQDNISIQEYLLRFCSDRASKRLTRLRELDAPQCILKHAEKQAANPLSHITKKSLLKFGTIVFGKVTEQIGWGGKPYLRFTDPNFPDQDILYVRSKWGNGRYLYRQNPK